MINIYMEYFLLIFFCSENYYLLHLHRSYHMIYHVSNFLFIKLLTLSHTLLYLFNSLLSLILKDIAWQVLWLSKHLVYSIIGGIVIHKGLITSSLLLIKHLIDLFVPYGSFLKPNILSTSTSSILNSFFFM